MVLSFYRRPVSERRTIMAFFSWLRNRTSLRSPRGRAQRRPAARHFRPRLEALEDRTLPSTYYAATASQLIADISAANKAGGPNTIVLTAPTTSPYLLTAVNNTTDGATGLPVISGGGVISGKGKKGTVTVAADNLTIIGNGDTIERSTAAGTPACRLLDVAKGASLTLQDVTLQNGFALGSGVWAEGGAIYNQGTLVLSAVLLHNNVAEGDPGGYDAAGGGVWSNGSLTLENASVIQGNSALGGPSDSQSPGGSAFGGGVYVAGGTANLTGTTCTSNKAQGGGVNGIPGTVGGSAYGGAVYVAGGTVTLSADTLGNTPGGGGGGAGGNRALGSAPYEVGLYGNGNGGALYVAGGNVALTNDYVIGNLADGDDYLGSYTGGIFIASGATVSLDSLTLYGTTLNTTYREATGGYVYDSQIVGTYTLLS
jgi:hypothetical protein